MELCVSALAWPDGQDSQGYEILSANKIRRVELVPGRIGDSNKVMAELARFQLLPTAFQALLFRTSDLYLFGTEQQREGLFVHLSKQCQLAAQLGVRTLVFGSPRNRSFDPAVHTLVDARRRALSFFNELGRTAEACGVTVCLEPNPVPYGCNFLTNTDETLKFVVELARAGIKMNLDAGALQMNGEPVEDIISSSRGHIGHVHLSEPQLSEVGMRGDHFHDRVLRALEGIRYGGACSIEMACKGEGWPDALQRSIKAMGRLRSWL